MKKPDENPAPAVTAPQRPNGGVQHDERGHAIWQWANDTARNAMNSTSAMLRKLEVPGLSLQDDPPPGTAARARSTDARKGSPQEGYSSYNGARIDAARPGKSAAGAIKASAAVSSRPSWWRRLLPGG